MKKSIIYISFFLLIFILSSCYFTHTPLVPDPAGFHPVLSSPFDSAGGIPVSSIAGSDNMAVAVSEDGTIAFSHDSGVSWEKVKSENIFGYISGANYNTVTYGEGWFLAGGNGGIAAYSRDGIIWHAGVIGPMSPKNILCAAIGKIMGVTVFVTAGNDGRLAHAMGSPEGPWYMADQSPFGSVQDYGGIISGLAYGKVKGNGVFVAVGDQGRIAFMKDFSAKWYGDRAGTGGTFRSVAFGNDRFMALGDNGLMKYSFDPREYTWITVKDTVFGLRQFAGVEFDPVTKHFAAWTNDNVFGFSEFGEMWNAAVLQSKFPGGSSTERISAAACTGHRIILGGSMGTIVYSN